MKPYITPKELLQLAAYDSAYYEGYSEPLEKAAKEIRRLNRLAQKMADILMSLGEGNDCHDDANDLVEKHFPKVYKRYQ